MLIYEVTYHHFYHVLWSHTCDTMWGAVNDAIRWSLQVILAAGYQSAHTKYIKVQIPLLQPSLCPVRQTSHTVSDMGILLNTAKT